MWRCDCSYVYVRYDHEMDGNGRTGSAQRNPVQLTMKHNVVESCYIVKVRDMEDKIGLLKYAREV